MSGAYFDHNATTPLDPEVRDAMLPWMGESWGNPSSIHAHGQRASAAVEAARREVARAIGASPAEVVFTASGTEANNAVVATALRSSGAGAPLSNFVLSGLEHPSVLGASRAWGPAAGVEVRAVDPDGDGVVRPEAIAAVLDGGTRLAAVMLANNEVGTVQPVAAIAAICRERGVPLLVDAVQALGKIAVDVRELGADYVTVAAHKMHGPLGAAALWVRPGSAFEPLLVGGAQERKRRASTVNVPAVVGFGAACAKLMHEGGNREERLRALRDRFERGLAAIPDTIVHGAGAQRLPHTSHVAFPGVVGQELAIRLDLAGFAVSTGAACGSGTVQASPMLLAMGVPAEESIASLRISFGIPNTEAEIDAFLPVLAREVAELRKAGVARAPRAAVVAAK